MATITRRSSRRRGAYLFAGLSALLCPHAASADLPPDCKELGPALVGHSCFHAEHGPYEAVEAAPGLTEIASAPDVDDVHTLYEITLPTPLEANTVTYRVADESRAGPWAFFSDPDVTLRVFDPAGNELAPLLLHDITPCGPLERTAVYELDFVRYRVVLGPSSRAKAPLVIESVEDFVTFNGRDVDGDGFGDPSDTVVTMCAPPEGYAPNDNDCDDANPSIHPGATEVCEGVDTNCNGVPDDVGLPCDAGAGACKASGTYACEEDGAPVVCSAVPKEPSTELCDGVDEDCDGVPDGDEEEICNGDAGGARCVSVLGSSHCGCATDADCTEGSHCDAAQARCAADVALDGDREVESGCGCRVGAQDGEGARFALAALALSMARRRRRSSAAPSRLALVAALLLLAGCGSHVVVEQGEKACVPRLGELPVAHACSHVEHGEPTDVVAAKDDAAALPSVDDVHDAFRVALPSQGGESSGVVGYLATRDGEHAIFVHPAVPLRVERAASGETLPIVETTTPTSCAFFSEAPVVDLRKDEQHRVYFGPTDAAKVELFIEHLGSFADEAWAVRCPSSSGP
ncbi:putative metal-binding motif-containing protein [Polyangium mundeleinium]|uniref:Metal-binding motif-containing protein n=1 Tax=Polyangium mundeleinium TaxID=2995306 RepID=A0ABT5EXS9_9BACT|nr:putative metal-binding motif-containing protein [Polyangium mundeleinium]MDC0746159.1 putative metal-binding motif-containing protein [Polyangium mundeleinium]